MFIDLVDHQNPKHQASKDAIKDQGRIRKERNEDSKGRIMEFDSLVTKANRQGLAVDCMSENSSEEASNHSIG